MSCVKAESDVTLLPLLDLLLKSTGKMMMNVKDW
jgi:hypothetical protein